LVDPQGREWLEVRSRPNVPGRRVQLHRAVSKLGWGSRTQAWQWIAGGEVEVDGRVVTDPLTWVDLDRQTITRRGEAAPLRSRLVLALYKPRGHVTTRRDERGRPTVYDLLPPGLPHVFPAGRLDADSEGLLILTSDSEVSVRLTDPEQHVAKTYRVTVAGRPADEALARLRAGVDLADGRTRPARVRLVRAGQRTSVLEVVLTEGRNRQVRRMLAAVGHKVRRLERVAIGALELGAMKPGECRVLSDEEIRAVLRGGGEEKR
jgi:23S rRNA pseudouridine2605 synthase